jgi:hypothetical protein
VTTNPSWQLLVDVPTSIEAPALTRHAAHAVLAHTGLQEADRHDLLIDLSELVELLVGASQNALGNIAVSIRISDELVELEVQCHGC